MKRLLITRDQGRLRFSTRALFLVACSCLFFGLGTAQQLGSSPCKDALLQDTFRTHASTSIRSHFESFVKKTEDQVWNEYNKMSRGGNINVIVDGIPLGAGYDESSLRHLYRSIKSSYEEFVSKSYSEDSFFYNFVQLTRPDQIAAWLRCQEMHLLGARTITYQIIDDSVVGDKRVVQVRLDFSAPTDITAIAPKFASMKLVNMSESGTTFSDALREQWDGSKKKGLSAAGQFALEQRRLSGIISVYFAEDYKPIHILIPPIEAKPSKITLDWDMSRIVVRPVRFQLSDGNETRMEFQCEFRGTVGSRSLRFGDDGDGWDPGRQSVPITSWGWYPFSPVARSASVSALIGGGNASIRVVGTWARTPGPGGPERSISTHDRYCEGVGHDGHKFKLHDDSEQTLPFDAPGFSMSARDIEAAALRSVVDGQLAATVPLASSAYSALRVADVRCVLVEFTVELEAVYKLVTPSVIAAPRYSYLLVEMMPDTEGETRTWGRAFLHPGRAGTVLQDEEADKVFNIGAAGGPKSLRADRLTALDLAEADAEIVVRVGKQGGARVAVRIVGVTGSGQREELAGAELLSNPVNAHDIRFRWRE